MMSEENIETTCNEVCTNPERVFRARMQEAFRVGFDLGHQKGLEVLVFEKAILIGGIVLCQELLSLSSTPKDQLYAMLFHHRVAATLVSQAERRLKTRHGTNS